jgi:phytoene dehydrogenase-like protein
VDYDLVVIGGGHNALVSAAYVAQAGYRVGVFERRTIVGGAVSTGEIVPEYAFDFGGSAHILIRVTPVIEELGLNRFGLEYVELDPLFYSPRAGNSPILIYRGVEETAERLDSILPGEGEAYARFVAEWRPFAEAVREAFLGAPSPFELGRAFIRPGSTKVWQSQLATILKPYGEVVDSYFKSESLKTLLCWMAAQSGPPPTEPLTAPFLLWHPLYHFGGIGRPKGGSGMLTVALQRHIEGHGGDVHLQAPVEEILVEGRRAVGVRVRGEAYTARSVLAGTHVWESLGSLLPPEHRPASLQDVRVGNGFGAILRLALSEPVAYADGASDEARRALQLLCRDRQQITDAYADYLKGHPSEDPPIVAMTFSAVDPTLAPSGGEVLWLWAQYFPYALRDGRDWDGLAHGVAERILDAFEQYAPGTRDKIVGGLFQHPVWLERGLGLPRGNVMHLEMSLDQMFAFRPSLELSQYRTHLDGLFITGASTHPGGGIMGASGRNAARQVLKALDRSRYS